MISPYYGPGATQNATSSSGSHPDQWSLVTVTYKDRTLAPLTMNVKASPSLAKYLSQEMRDTGFCYLFSGNHSLVIAASEIQSIQFTKLTTEENP